MAVADDQQRTEAALYALGVDAVKLLEDAMKQGSGVVPAYQAQIAGQILDRIGFQRSGLLRQEN